MDIAQSNTPSEVKGRRFSPEEAAREMDYQLSTVDNYIGDGRIQSRLEDGLKWVYEEDNAALFAERRARIAARRAQEQLRALKRSRLTRQAEPASAE